MSAFSYEHLGVADLSADKRGVDDRGSGREPLGLVIEFPNRTAIASYDAWIDRLPALASPLRICEIEGVEFLAVRHRWPERKSPWKLKCHRSARLT